MLDNLSPHNVQVHYFSSLRAGTQWVQKCDCELLSDNPSLQAGKVFREK